MLDVTVYGFGKSEELTGEFLRRKGASPVIATKFAPLPWRFTSDSVVSACRVSVQTEQSHSLREELRTAVDIVNLTTSFLFHTGVWRRSVTFPALYSVLQHDGV